MSRERLVGVLFLALLLSVEVQPRKVIYEKSGKKLPKPGTPEFAAQKRSSLPTDPPSCATKGLAYHGGPVLRNPEVWLLFWDHTVQYQQETINYYRGMIDGPYMDWLDEYGIEAGGAPIGRGSVAGSHTIYNTVRQTNILDHDEIISVLKGLWDAGTIPSPVENNNRYYAFHFPPDLTITHGQSVSCVDFCGYHNSVKYNGTWGAFGIMPDMAPCWEGCGGQTEVFDSVMIVASHELLEAVTDPAVGDQNQLTWYDFTPDCYEICDICGSSEAWALGGDGNYYLFSYCWSNQQFRCTLANNSTTTPTCNTAWGT